MRRLPLLLACGAMAVGITPSAHAAGGTVKAEYKIILKPFGTSYLVVADCSATATPATEVDVPLAVSVTCYLKKGTPQTSGTPSTNALPGARVDTVLQDIGDAPMQLCYSATASFFQSQPPGTYAASAPEVCDPVGP